MRSRFKKSILPLLNERGGEKIAGINNNFYSNSSFSIHPTDALAANEKWRALSRKDIEDLFPRKLLSNNPNDLFIPPATLMSDEIDLTDPKHTVCSVLTYLKQESGQPQSVVVHALIVNSGVVQDALEYMNNPRGTLKNNIHYYVTNV